MGIVFDTGMNRIGDALALALLYGLTGKNECRVAAVSVSASNLQAAAYCEVVSRFYAGPAGGTPGGAAGSLPVGLSVAGKLKEDSPLFTAPLGRRDAEGRPVYRHSIHKVNDTADPPSLIRNALTAQLDGNAVVLLSGPATNLAGVLSLRGARELISSKVRLLAVAAGVYPEGAPDALIEADAAASAKVFAGWPTPVVACGAEVGRALPFPASSIEKDFAWSPAHPVVDAYRAYRAMPYDASTEALAAALYAVRMKENYFQLSEPGTIGATAEGRTKFTPAAEGKHHYLIVDPGEKARIIKAYMELASAKPVSRVPRAPSAQQ